MSSSAVCGAALRLMNCRLTLVIQSSNLFVWAFSSKLAPFLRAMLTFMSQTRTNTSKTPSGNEFVSNRQRICGCKSDAVTFKDFSLACVSVYIYAYLCVRACLLLFSGSRCLCQQPFHLGSVQHCVERRASGLSCFNGTAQFSSLAVPISLLCFCPRLPSLIRLYEVEAAWKDFISVNNTLHLGTWSKYNFHSISKVESLKVVLWVKSFLLSL